MIRTRYLDDVAADMKTELLWSPGVMIGEDERRWYGLVRELVLLTPCRHPGCKGRPGERCTGHPKTTVTLWGHRHDLRVHAVRRDDSRRAYVRLTGDRKGYRK